MLLPESFIIARRIAIITAALTAGIPSVSFSAAFADDGALATYSAAPYEAVRRVAYDVDRMLRGAKPSDLSVEQPSQLTATINLKTAASLGLRIRNSLLVQANKLIR